MIACPRCHLKDLADERALAAHLVTDHLQNATQAAREARQAATGIRLDEEGACDACHRKDGTHTPSCYLAKNARAAGLDPAPVVLKTPIPIAPKETPMSMCKKCGKTGHNSRSCGREPRGNAHGTKRPDAAAKKATGGGKRSKKPKPAKAGPVSNGLIGSPAAYVRGLVQAVANGQRAQEELAAIRAELEA